MAIELYAADKNHNEYQRVGFDFVLTAVTIVCVCLSIGSIIVGLPWVQQRYEAYQRKETDRQLKTIQSKATVIVGSSDREKYGRTHREIGCAILEATE